MKRAIILLAFALLVSGCGGSKAASGPKLTPVVRGIRLGGSVLIVAYSDGDVRICESSIILVDFGSAHAPNCRKGLPATGVRVSALHDHSTKPRERWGTIYVVGTYHGGVFRVSEQRRHGPRRPDPAHLSAPPPCQAPAGGWRPPASDIGEEDAVAAYRHRHPGEITAWANFKGVLVLTSTKPAQTRKRLLHGSSDAICVVRARYSGAVVHRVEQRMRKLAFREWNGKLSHATYGWISSAGGFGEDVHGQPTTGLDVLLVTPRLRAFVRRQPRGLVEVQASLQPVRSLGSGGR